MQVLNSIGRLVASMIGYTEELLAASWGFPEAFLLIPLVFLCLVFIARKTNTHEVPALTIASERLLPNRPSLKVVLRKPILRTLLAVSFLTLVTAAARPQRVITIDQPEERRNLMLALDLSGSMRRNDFLRGRWAISRLDAVKQVVSDFVKDRSSDRIGLVVFGDRAHLECPLTTDTMLLNRMVTTLFHGMVGDNTALGDGLGVALKHVEEVPAESSSIILLTDGVATAGDVQPLQAARVAKDLGVKVYTIGVGNPGRGTKKGDFDEETLQEIAALTGGSYFNAAGYESLQRVYEEIDSLEQSEKDSPPVTVTKELFTPLAWLGLALLSALTLLQATWFLTVP